MKRPFLLSILCVAFFYTKTQDTWIRVNLLGYLPNAPKIAVLVTKNQKLDISSFVVFDANSNKDVLKSTKITAYGKWGAFEKGFRLNFSDLKQNGEYYVKAGSVKSPKIKINGNVYDKTADFLLNYMRQQRCGYNPFFKENCHLDDGYIIYHPDKSKDSTHIDVTGGWHDASDYLQYVTTSANAVYQMLFAYKQNPEAFADEYLANGDSGKNGIPDILDEAKHGLDWLDKMNPSKYEMYNQLADDRDHVGFKKPSNDHANYGKGKERPVYFCTGKPQGSKKYQNNATGIASTAGKYASAFALGSDLLKQYYPDFSNKIYQKAIDAYSLGKRNPGACQTACYVSPYFYAEDNWVDDMELAAAQLNITTKDKSYVEDAVLFGKQEKTTPWMGSDTAKHYQWYPFINLGHYLMATNVKSEEKNDFNSFFKLGIEKVYNKGKNNMFLMGVPFIWCSNNLVVGLLTQCNLYRRYSADLTYQEYEFAMIDWLFGVNPWGTSMIIGMPENGGYPKYCHSYVTKIENRQPIGGLVDGPIYGSIFGKLAGVTTSKEDEYKDFQSSLVVYHDDWSDYSSNEPTMDGTASLSYILSALEMEGKNNVYETGAIVRKDTSKKVIHIAFTAHDFSDGGELIAKTLKKQKIKGSFFFTGDFYREKKFEPIIKKLIKDGNYLGSHSDKHLLYCDWVKRDSLLLTEQEFKNDLSASYLELAKFGINKSSALYFLPPFEYHNRRISDWTKDLGLTLVNFSPGTSSNADYTTPDMKNYLSSDVIFNKILDYELKNTLKGFILLIHFGTDEKRKDKFYNKLESLITELKARGYTFKKIDE